MRDNENQSSAFDAALGDVLPDDLEEAAIAQDSSAGGDGWFAVDYTFTQQVPAEHRDNAAMSEIERLCGELDLPDSVAAMATQTFQQYASRAEHYFLVELYAAAALYCAAKLSGEAISPDELAAAGPDLLTRKVLLRRSKRIASELGFDPGEFNDASQYVDRYCDELELSDKVRQDAHEIIGRSEDAGKGTSYGVSPTGWAAAAVYLSASKNGCRVTQEQVGKVAGVSELTIRNRYQEQAEMLGETDS